MINYENKAINLHAEVYGWMYRALEEMIKAEWHNDELFLLQTMQTPNLDNQDYSFCSFYH